MCSAFQTDRDVTEFGNHFEVSPGPAAKIKYCETRLTLDVLQHRSDVLADIVIASACPELFGTPVIMFQCGVDYCFRSCPFNFYSFSSQRLCDLLRHKNRTGYLSLVTNRKSDASDARVSIRQSHRD